MKTEWMGNIKVIKTFVPPLKSEGFFKRLLLMGSFTVSSLFALLFEAITARDYPIIQAFTVVIATGYVILNLIVDVSYAYLDPRIRLE